MAGSDHLAILPLTILQRVRVGASEREPVMTERILIIEDDRKLAPLVQRYLEDHGYAVDWVADGDGGARAIERSAPDLVLLD
ncbi:MAG: response regulator, partial [Acidobacteriota bacterium]